MIELVFKSAVNGAIRPFNATRNDGDEFVFGAPITFDSTTDAAAKDLGPGSRFLVSPAGHYVGIDDRSTALVLNHGGDDRRVAGTVNLRVPLIIFIPPIIFP